jgi:hypothetical protein
MISLIKRCIRIRIQIKYSTRYTGLNTNTRTVNKVCPKRRIVE